MNAVFRKIWLTGYCFLLFVFANSQVNFYTTVSANEIGKDEYVSYRIIIENPSNIQNITHPSFNNFIQLSSPTTINGVNSINGQVTRYISIEYALKPKRPGKFVIGPAKATIGNKVFWSNSNPVIVKKTTGNTYPQSQFLGMDPFPHQRPLSDFKDYIFYKGDSLQQKISSNMEFRVETDKAECYVGEPIVASYKLYTRLKSESKLTQSPSFTGFSVVYMQDHGDYAGNTRGKLNGKECNVLTIRKAQLYALQPGVISLETAELENNVQFIKEAYANQLADAGRVFDDFPTAVFPTDALLTQDVVLSTKPLDITVKPLPDKDRPATFNGAVGDFTIEASLQKPLFSTDEAGKLLVVVAGRGNMQLLTPPDIQWPKGIEYFDPKVTDKLVRETVPVSGSKKFEYSFAADDSGHYVLAPIHFSYFDPASGNYKTVSTDPIVFQVTKGSGRPPDFAKATEQNDNTTFITRVFNHRWWIVVFIAGLIVTGLIIWLMRGKKEEEAPLVIPVVPEVDHNHMLEAGSISQQNVFSESEKCLYADDCVGFYSLLNTELKNYLAATLAVNANSINSLSIGSLMDMRGIPNSIVLKLQQLMQAIEWQLYTPFERNEKMNDLYQQAHEIVQEINAAGIRHP